MSVFEFVYLFIYLFIYLFLFIYLITVMENLLSAKSAIKLAVFSKSVHVYKTKRKATYNMKENSKELTNNYLQ